MQYIPARNFVQFPKKWNGKKYAQINMGVVKRISAYSSLIQEREYMNVSN